MKYPLKLKSTILDSEITITDADGQTVFRMNAFMILEGAHRLPVYKIKSDIMFAPVPVFRVNRLNDEPVFSVRRNNLFSLFESWYQILVGDEVKLIIREGKAMGNIFGGLFDGTPLEHISARVWNPAFVVLRSENTKIMTLDKRRSHVGKHYRVNKHSEFVDDEEERMVLLSLFGLMFLEKTYRYRLF